MLPGDEETRLHRRVAVIQGPAFGQDPGKGGRISEVGGQLIDRIQ